jgi:hypothetical protein
MRKALALAVVVMLVASAAAFADYNHDTTVKAMRENAANLGKLNAAAGTSDFTAAKDALLGIGRNAVMLAAMEPPKGDKGVWAATQTELAAAVLKGVIACEGKDKPGLDAAIADITKTRNKGHQTFRG